MNDNRDIYLIFIFMQQNNWRNFYWKWWQQNNFYGLEVNSRISKLERISNEELISPYKTLQYFRCYWTFKFKTILFQFSNKCNSPCKKQIIKHEKYTGIKNQNIHSIMLWTFFRVLRNIRGKNRTKRNFITMVFGIKEL